MSDFLVVDLKAVLDQTRAGKEGALKLEMEWVKLKGTKDGVAKMEALRAELRSKLLDRASEVVRAIAAERKAGWVLERGAVPLCPPEADITKLVVEKLDRG